MNSSQCSFFNLLPEFVHGTLPDTDQELVQLHLQKCDYCKGLVTSENDQTCLSDQYHRLSQSRFDRFLPAKNIHNSPTPVHVEFDPQIQAETNRHGHRLSAIQPNSAIDHYEICELIGKGGMGIVFRAKDTLLDRVVAIKVLGQLSEQDQECHERFLREARAAASIKHANVVTVYGVGGFDCEPYIAMEYVDGISLQDYLRLQGPLSAEEIITIGVQIAEGLSAAHVQGLIHRDIKPANILIERTTGLVKITDFGLARLHNSDRLTQSGIVCGTTHYLAPEQALGKPLDHRADLFSFGTVLYEMCSGQHPFDGLETMATLKKICDEEPLPLDEIASNTPVWLRQLIKSLHAKNPDDRPQSAETVVEILRNQDYTAKISPRKSTKKTAKRAVFVRNRILRYCLIFLLLAGCAFAAPAVVGFFIRNKHTSHLQFAEYYRQGLPTGSVNVHFNNLKSKQFLNSKGVTYRHVESQIHITLNHGKYKLPTGEFELDMFYVPVGMDVPASFTIRKDETTDLPIFHTPQPK